MTRKDAGVIAGLLFAGAVVGSVVTAHYTMQSEEVPCVAGQDEICAPAQWVKKLDQLHELNRQGAELSNKLNAAVPGGFHIDQATGLKFLKDAPKPPAPPATAAQPPAQPVTPPKK